MPTGLRETIMSMPTFDMTRDHFALFDLSPAYKLDLAVLDQRYRDIQTQIHPDKYAHLGESEQRVAMQWATRANEAYQTLRSPLKRAQYLLHLRGIDLQIERNTAMPMDFLVQQLECREGVAEARANNDADELDQLHRALKRDMHAEFVLLEQQLDETHDNPGAAETVRRLMFLEKLLHEIDEALEAVEAA